MSTPSKPSPIAIAAKLPAEPGWRALIVRLDGDRPVETAPGVCILDAVPIAAWGVELDARSCRSGLGAMFAAALGGIFGATDLRLAPLDTEGQRIDTRPGFRGVAAPGESNQDAADRIDGPTLTAERKRRESATTNDAGPAPAERTA